MDSDFEKKLARQTMRELPPEWRAEILQAATHHLPARQGCWPTVIYRQFASLLWPRPLAWTGLAAVWVAILVLNSASSDDAPRVAVIPSPAPNWIATLREQQRLIDELVAPMEEPRVQRSEETKPRSQLRRRQPFALA